MKTAISTLSLLVLLIVLVQGNIHNVNMALNNQLKQQQVMKEVPMEEVLGERLPGTVNPCYYIRPNYTGTLGVTSVCFPKIWCAGLAKAGSSALFYYFLKNLNNRILFVRKEWCPSKRRGGGALNVLQEYIESIKKFDYANQSIIYTGCMKYDDSLFRELANRRLIKVVWIFRYFPGWVYSIYNYYCMKGEIGCTIDKLRDKKRPELKDLFKTPAKFDAFIRDTIEKGLLGRMGHPSAAYPLKSYNPYSTILKDIVKTWDMLLIRSEDLFFQTNKTVEAVFKFIGLPLPKYESDVLGNAINALDNPGFMGLSPKSHGLGGVAQPMLKETEEYLLNYWKEDCQWLRNSTNIRWRCSLQTDFF